VLNFILVVHYTTYIVLSDKYAMFLYRKGLLTRCKESVEKHKGRKGWSIVAENFFVSFVTLLPVSWYVVKTVLPVLASVDTSFKVVEVWCSLCGIYICFDVWYYFTHRFVHQNAFLYRYIHKRHHDTTPVDSYITGHAEVLENLLFTTPGVYIWAVIYLNAVHTPNLWAIVIPVLSLLNDFVLVHIGFYDTALLYAINPFSYIVQLTLASRQLCARHELHHNLVRRNYSPMLPWCDVIFGTGKKAEKQEWGITFVHEQRATKVHQQG